MEFTRSKETLRAISFRKHILFFFFFSPGPLGVSLGQRVGQTEMAHQSAT
jgi:hypothetical protein